MPCIVTRWISVSWTMATTSWEKRARNPSWVRGPHPKETRRPCKTNQRVQMSSCRESSVANCSTTYCSTGGPKLGIPSPDPTISISPEIGKTKRDPLSLVWVEQPVIWAQEQRLWSPPPIMWLLQTRSLCHSQPPWRILFLPRPPASMSL
jgi:hypothetical protein